MGCGGYRLIYRRSSSARAVCARSVLCSFAFRPQEEIGSVPGGSHNSTECAVLTGPPHPARLLEQMDEGPWLHEIALECLRNDFPRSLSPERTSSCHPRRKGALGASLLQGPETSHPSPGTVPAGFPSLKTSVPEVPTTEERKDWRPLLGDSAQAGQCWCLDCHSGLTACRLSPFASCWSNLRPSFLCRRSRHRLTLSRHHVKHTLRPVGSSQCGRQGSLRGRPDVERTRKVLTTS